MQVSLVLQQNIEHQDWVSDYDCFEQVSVCETENFSWGKCLVLNSEVGEATQAYDQVALIEEAYGALPDEHAFQFLAIRVEP